MAKIVYFYVMCFLHSQKNKSLMIKKKDSHSSSWAHNPGTETELINFPEGKGNDGYNKVIKR